MNTPLDSLACSQCGNTSCVSWSCSEGYRCHEHSSYSGFKAAAANRKGVGGEGVDPGIVRALFAACRQARQMNIDARVDGRTPPDVAARNMALLGEWLLVNEWRLRSQLGCE